MPVIGSSTHCNFAFRKHLTPLNVRQEDTANEPRRGEPILPPRYLVPPEIESEFDATGRHGSTNDPPARGDPGIGIDPGLLRIRRRLETVAVKPLSRDDKDLRKRWRVALVFVFGLAILIAVLAWLLRFSTPAL